MNNSNDPRLQALEWKAKLYLQLHRLRISPPGRMTERVIWWLVG